MKSSASIAISLTLLMFILVLSAAVFFLLQGQQNLKGELSNSEENIKTLRQQQAEMELNERAVQATLETLQTVHATSAVENVDLEGQLLDSVQANETLEASSAQRLSELENVNATVTAFESQGPLVKIVGPQDGATLTPGQPVEIVIVATDPAGVTTILFNIGDEFFSLPFEGKPVETLREEWIPTDAGTFKLVASAINSKEKPSRSSDISFTVNSPVSTNTPEPTEEPTPES